jgi:hypothetical protein
MKGHSLLRRSDVRMRINPDSGHRHEAVIWHVDGTDDISQSVRRMINEIESVCRPVLAPPPVEERIRLWIEQMPQLVRRVRVIFERRA